MEIKTWVKYEEEYLPSKRHRKFRYRECEEFIDVDLKEASMSQLQKAFEDNSYGGKGEIFVFGEKLWVKAKIGDICAPGGEDEHGYHTPLEALMWWQEHGSAYFRSGFDREYYGMDTSRSAVIGRAENDMRKYLLVDGELYVVTAEPRYCITTFGCGHNHGGTGLFCDYRYNENLSCRAYFSALDGDKAVLEANRVAEARGDTKDVGRFKPFIVVFMPELVKVDPERQHIK